MPNWEAYYERQWQMDAPCVTVLSERRVRARKAHKCWCCGATIAPGEHYIRFAYMDDEVTPSKFQCVKQHIMCEV